MTVQVVFFFVIANMFATLAIGQESPIVTTKTGQIRGQLISLTSPSLQVYQFTAIPFAEPPIGERRFRKPVPKEKWDGILEANKVPNVCPQVPILPPEQYLNSSFATIISPKALQSEDCLYLNIWVPKAALDNVAMGILLPPEQNLAVFFFIHGGGFMVGSSSVDIYNGTILAAFNNIIVVSIQYRLGSLGFAYLGNDEVPGNMGLWDQLEAVKWINENIASFGGNGNEVTIAGESAGSDSVSLHLLSPYSRPYFKRAILQSGSVLAPWAYRTAEQARTMTALNFDEIAKIQCPEMSNNNTEMIACLLSVNSTVIANTSLSSLMEIIGPVIDGDFIPRDPVLMMQQGDFYQVPLLLGANENEGSVFLLANAETSHLLSNETAIEALNFTNFGELLEAGFSSMLASNETFNPILLKAILYQYWPTRREGFPRGSEIIEAAAAAPGDYALTCPTYTFADVASQFDNMGAQIFAYLFAQRRSNHPLPTWTGVLHGDELPFVFGEPFAPYAVNYGYSYEDKAFSRVVMAYWTNFAKYGNPNVKDINSFNIVSGPLQLRYWPPYVGEFCNRQIVELKAAIQMYNFGADVTCGLKTRECSFWNDFYPMLAQALTKNIM